MQVGGQVPADLPLNYAVLFSGRVLADDSGGENWRMPGDFGTDAFNTAIDIVLNTAFPV